MSQFRLRGNETIVRRAVLDRCKAHPVWAFQVVGEDCAPQIENYMRRSFSVWQRVAARSLRARPSSIRHTIEDRTRRERRSFLSGNCCLRGGCKVGVNRGRERYWRVHVALAVSDLCFASFSDYSRSVYSYINKGEFLSDMFWQLLNYIGWRGGRMTSE